MIKWFKHSLLGIIVLSLVASFIYDGIKSIPFGSAIVKLVTWLYASVINIFTFKIPVWALISLLILWIVLFFVIVKRPSYYQYNKAIFRKWIWRWKYYFNGREWKVFNLIAYCPICDIELVDNSTSRIKNKYCPKCRADYSDRDDEYEYIRDVQILINAAIEKKEYLQEN